jgi:hypothetical protein
MIRVHRHGQSRCIHDNDHLGKLATCLAKGAHPRTPKFSEAGIYLATLDTGSIAI